ncbi:MAG: hypothetical protein IJ112_04160 [Oscillospiraceae bacterium]|nr:hypothetical protein [Oscillospiraceae bacterium]
MQDKKAPVITEPLDHTKKYFRVNGYEIAASFTQERRPDTFRRVRSILLTASAPDCTIDAA